MIGRALIGGIVAAVAIFILGFIFFATPISKLGTGTLDNAQAAAVQQSLASNVPSTGTYFVPSAETPEQSVMYSQGPIATLHYNSVGYAAADPAALIGGFIHMLVVGLLMAVGLYTISLYVPSFGERVRLLVLGTLGAIIFARLGEPIWYHHDWSNAIYLFVAESLTLIAGGLIVLKMLPRDLAGVRNRPAAPPA